MDEKEHKLSYTVLIDTFGVTEKVTKSIAKTLGRALYNQFGGRATTLDHQTGERIKFDPKEHSGD